MQTEEFLTLHSQIQNCARFNHKTAQLDNYKSARNNYKSAQKKYQSVQKLQISANITKVRITKDLRKYKEIICNYD